MSAVAAAQSPRREIEVISLVGFAHGVSHFFHLLIPPLFPWLMQEFGLSFTQAGALTAVFFAVSGIGQALAGFVVDHLGARRVLLIGMSFFALASVMLGSATSYGALITAAAIAGFGNSVFHPADFTLLNRNVTGKRLGHAFSVHGLSGNLGWALSPVFLTTIAVAAGWRTAAFAAASMAVLAFVLIFIRRDTMTESRIQTESGVPVEAAASTFTFLTSSAVWMCFVFFFLVTMAFGAMQNFAPAVLQNVYGLSLAAGATALTSYLLGGAAGMAAGGFMVSRSEEHERRIALVLAVSGVLALGIASGQVPTWGLLPLMAAIGFCVGIAGPSRDMLVRRAATARFGQKSFGRVYGFVYSGLDAGLALAPFIFGPLMDAGLFTWVLGGFALLQGAASLAALNVARCAR